jgi:inner membrane protein
MPDVQAPPPLPKSQPFFARRDSTILKLLGVGALVLVLIPLTMITGVLTERLQRRNEAVADMTSAGGREQNVIGLVLGVPYQ